MATSKKKKSAKQARAKRGASQAKPAKKKGGSAKKSTAKKASPKKKVAAKKAAPKKAVKRPAKKASKKASKKAAPKAPKKKTVAAKGSRIAERPAKAERSTEPEERVKPFHREMEEEEPEIRRREPVELGEEMEDELGNGMALDDDEEPGADFLDKPEDLSSDEDTE